VNLSRGWTCSVGDAVDLARALTQGWLDAGAVPELDSPATEQEVAARLADVGHVLRRIGDHWLAEPVDLVGDVTLRHPLSERELAIVAVLYLHLVFLPTEHGRDPAREGDSVAADEIVVLLQDQGVRRGDAESSVRRVCAAGWARRTAGRLHAAPPLISMDDPSVHEAVAITLMQERIARLRDAPREGLG
jgi:hypothetical protein